MVKAGLLPLVAEAIEVWRGPKRLIGPIDVTLAGGGITVVMGPNGGGKTTLLRALHGLERLRRGRIGWAVPTEDTRHHQSFVFQTPILLRRTVRDNIAFPLGLDGVRRSEARERASRAAEAVGLGDRLSVMAHDLSGGEKQKLAIARALIRDPAVLFLDEPCSNLDGASTRDIEAILLAARDAGTSIVLSTHDIGQARRLAARVLFLHRGLLCEDSPAERFFASPATQEARAYLNGEILL